MIVATRSHRSQTVDGGLWTMDGEMVINVVRCLDVQWHLGIAELGPA